MQEAFKCFVELEKLIAFELMHICIKILFFVFLNAMSSVQKHLKVPERWNCSLAFFAMLLNGKLK